MTAGRRWQTDRLTPIQSGVLVMPHLVGLPFRPVCAIINNTRANLAGLTTYRLRAFHAYGEERGGMQTLLPDSLSFSGPQGRPAVTRL